MRTNRSKDGRDGASRRDGGLPGTAVILLLAAAAIGTASVGAAAAEPLRWKFKEGETLRISIEQKTIMNTKGMGFEHRSNRTQTLDYTWKVLSVGPGGEAEINHKIERIRMRADEPPYQPFDFDSGSTKEAQAGFEGVTRQLKAEVGAEFTFKIKPTGEIIDVKVPEETLKRYREASPGGGPGAGINEKSLKEVLLQASPPSFPDGPVEPGKTWTSKPARLPVSLPGPNPPLATLVLDRTFTYHGPDPKALGSLLVGIDTTAKVEPIEGIDVKVTIRKQEGRGSMTVDNAAGRVVSTRLGVKLELAVAGPMGQVIEQSSESSSSMTLSP